VRIHRFLTTQFRNLQHEPLDFDPTVNLLVGENGQGKTNVLEALYLFKFGRSFRTVRDHEMIRFGEQFCRVDVDCSDSRGERSRFEAAIERSGDKTIKHDGKEVAKYSELVGRYPAVIFGPDDLDIVSGYPAERRRFLDMVGSMTDRAYLDDLRAYRRVLTQRNAALKAQRLDEAQGVWAEELIRCGSSLVRNRQRLVRELAGEMAPHLGALGLDARLELEYESELTRNRPGEVSDEEQFAARLAAVEHEEARRRTTLVGPHRDDLQLRFNDHDVRRFGSQGQRRLTAILLRLTELTCLERRLDEPCVLLLDDLFSELDNDIAGRLRDHLEGPRQIFITSPLPLAWEGARAWSVTGGRVEG
jgi:DNA replication and repair protein RecF